MNQEKKNEKIYSHFLVIVDEKIAESYPGFAGALTVTTEIGRITGESLLVQIGVDQDIGKKLATILCLNLAYEALGKSIPKSEQDKQAEFNAYAKAVSDALCQQPGHINYPGYANQIIFSQTKEGNLLFVINNGVPGKH